MADPRMSSATVVNESLVPHGSLPPSEVTTLVIAWSAAEPSRVGEIAVLASAMSVLGRGVSDDPAEPRLRFFRQRPGTLEATEPLASPGLSRRQLLVHPFEGGARVELVGRCALEINGERCTEAEVRHGDVLHFRNELVLQCLRRSALIPARRLYPEREGRAFGAPDSFGILGESPVVWRLREAIAFAAKADTHVMVLGESGTGKELAARAIHALSTRAKRSFVARNAATLPATLVDAELFGNAKNYPNPGMQERAGLIGEADGGTLFLDEIGELPSEHQAHLLRVLDGDGEYQRLGEAQARRSGFRLVAATNRDPSALKHDFVARFTAQVELPSLEARKEDVPLLVQHLLAHAAKRSPEIAGRITRIDPQFVVYVLRRAFKGNIRELEALVWKALAVSHDDTLRLPPELLESPPIAAAPLPTIESDTSRPEPSEAEIRAALSAQSGSVPKAARALGMSSRYALYRLMKKMGINEE